MPPSETNPIKCNEELFSFTNWKDFLRFLFVEIELSLQALFIFTKSWSTILPAPIFKCPTSELPICPLGKPTLLPSVNNSELGYFVYKESM